MFRRIAAPAMVVLVGLTLGIGPASADAPQTPPAGLAELLADMSAEAPQAGRLDRAQAVNRLAGHNVPSAAVDAISQARKRWAAQAETLVRRLAENHTDTVRTDPQLQQLRRRAIVDIVLKPTADDDAWQAMVDRHVAAIRRHLCQPLDAQLESPFELGRIVALLDELHGYARMLGLTGSDASTPADALRELYCREVLLGDIEKQVLRHNRELSDELSEPERQCIRLLNDYRMLLGLHPLKIDMRLVRACRKYAAECADQNHYAHAGSLPGRQTRDQRAAQEGYPAHVAENLAFGMKIDTGRQAFREWFLSVPHHRVIINRRHALQARGDETAWKYPRYYAVGVGHATGGRYQHNWCLLLGTGHPLNADEVAQADAAAPQNTAER